MSWIVEVLVTVEKLTVEFVTGSKNAKLVASVAMLMSLLRSTLSRHSLNRCLPVLCRTDLLNVEWPRGFVDGYRSLSESSRSHLGDPIVERAVVERLRQLQARPVASEVVYLFWFLATESRNLDDDRLFVEVCDLAAILVRDFTPKEISLLVRISLQKTTLPHAALLECIAESLVVSRDLAAFPSVLLINLLMHISKRQRKARGFRITNDCPVLFPGQTEFVAVALEELMSKERLDALTVKEMVSVFYSALVLGFASSEALHRLKDQLINHAMHLTPRDVANVIYATAQTQFKDPGLLTALTRQYTLSHDRQAEISNLGLLLYGLAMMKDVIRPLQAVVRLCDHISLHHITRFSNEDLACLFYSLGKLSIGNADLIGLLSFEVQKASRLGSFEGQQILSILVAIRDLHYNDDTLINALSREVLVGKDPASGQDRMSQLKTTEVCGILQAWSRMNIRRDWAMQVLLTELMKDHRRQDLDEVSAALIVHSMGIAGIHDEAVLHYINTEWFTEEKLPQFDNHLVAAMICGLSRIPVARVMPTIRPLMKEMVKEGRLNHCEYISLIGVIHSVASIRELKPKDLVIVEMLLDAALKDRRLHEMSGRGLGLLVHALGKCSSLTNRLIYAEMIVLEALQSHRLPEIDNQALANMLWGLSRMFYPHRDHIKQLARELLQQRRSKGHREKGCIQLTHAVLALGDLAVQDCGDLLDFVARSLIRNGVRDVPSVGLVFLTTRLSKLGYRHEALYRLLVSEALRKERMKRMHPEDLPMIIEAIARMGDIGLVEEAVLMGLQGMDNLGRYTASDLWRLLKAILPLKGNHSIVDRLRNEWERRRTREDRRLFPAAE